MALGDRIKKVRLARQMTLAQVADCAHCSVGLLSQIENSKVMPSIKTLTAIAECLRVSPGDFFERIEDPTAVEITSPGERSAAGGLELLGQREVGVDKTVSLYLMTIAPDESVSPQAFPGYKFVYCIRGRITLSLGGQDHVIERGQTASFSAETPHVLSAGGDGPAEAVVMVTPRM